jgi:hypothetical protein
VIAAVPDDTPAADAPNLIWLVSAAVAALIAWLFAAARIPVVNPAVAVDTPAAGAIMPAAAVVSAAVAVETPTPDDCSRICVVRPLEHAAIAAAAAAILIAVVSPAVTDETPAADPASSVPGGGGGVGSVSQNSDAIA